MVLFVYVDNSNVWIEGRRASAVANALAPSFDDSFAQNIVDPNWNYDFGRLYELACPGDVQIG
ncbi:MAG: NYN domain-containing protein, partial [Nocardioidaceae bacterium]|nr:NYN domain-containing protein [Nocardioidaceae bacterium]